MELDFLVILGQLGLKLELGLRLVLYWVRGILPRSHEKAHALPEPKLEQTLVIWRL